MSGNNSNTVNYKVIAFCGGIQIDSGTILIGKLTI
mgnify:CR=1 FL=1